MLGESLYIHCISKIYKKIKKKLSLELFFIIAGQLKFEEHNIDIRQ